MEDRDDFGKVNKSCSEYSAETSFDVKNEANTPRNRQGKRNSDGNLFKFVGKFFSNDNEARAKSNK